MVKQKWLAVILVLFIAAGTAYAAKSSATFGQELFNDPKLGGSTNDSSCSSYQCRARVWKMQQEIRSYPS